MTELQKLSLKKLRKAKLPLFVLDRKSKRGGFVILDVEGFQESKKEGTKIPLPKIKAAEVLDYRNMALLWDRPSMTNKEFHDALKNPKHVEHLWAAKRFLERTPSIVVKDVYSLEELKVILHKVQLRPVILQEAWNRAIHYWSENP